MTKQLKERVDILLVERGLCETREKAKRSIMAGLVFLMKLALIRREKKLL